MTLSIDTEQFPATEIAGQIPTAEAADLLGLSPNELRTCALEFGFPSTCVPAGGRRQFELADVLGLRAALRSTDSLARAIPAARALAAVTLGATRLPQLTAS